MRVMPKVSQTSVKLRNSLLLQHEGVGHANGSFCGSFAHFQGWRLRVREHETALGIAAESQLDDFCRGGAHGVQAEYLTMFSSWAAAL